MLALRTTHRLHTPQPRPIRTRPLPPSQQTTRPTRRPRKLPPQPRHLQPNTQQQHHHHHHHRNTIPQLGLTTNTKTNTKTNTTNKRSNPNNNTVRTPRGVHNIFTPTPALTRAAFGLPPRAVGGGYIARDPYMYGWGVCDGSRLRGLAVVGI